ncbi:transcriptional regulator with XRE-family HTH domain [Sporosarcina luteola]|nr:transcriptional regulator with XRE-family HTH domain [Sporosarcina luteola]
MYIGSRIHKLREERGLSQKEASYGIISTSHYSNVESGRFVPSEDVLRLLAERFDVPFSYFFDIQKQDPALQKLLEEYEQLLSTEADQASRFTTKHAAKFSYIPSIQQEFHFNILKYISLVKTGEVRQAQKIYANEMIHLSQTDLETNKPLFTHYLYISGLFCYFNKNYRASITYYNTILELARKEEIIAKTFYNMSLALFHLYDYAEALDFVKKAQQQYINLHKWRAAGDCYNLAATILIELNKTTEAKQQIQKGFSVLGDNVSETSARLYHNLAYIQYQEKTYYDALKTINQCIELKQNMSRENLIKSYTLKISILFHLEDFMAIQDNIKQIQRFKLRERERIQLRYIETKMYYAVREFSLYEKNMQGCIRYFQNNEEWKYLKEAARHFSLYYANQKKYKMAYHYQDLCILSYQRLMGEMKGGETE